MHELSKDFFLFPFSKNKSRPFDVEQNLQGAFAIGTLFLLYTIRCLRSPWRGFFRRLSRGSNRSFILCLCLSVRLVGYFLITLMMSTIKLEEFSDWPADKFYRKQKNNLSKFVVSRSRQYNPVILLQIRFTQKLF